MRIRPHAFKADPVYTYLGQLSAHFGVPLYNDTTLVLPPEKGSGFIKNIFLEDDLCIRYYHFSLNSRMPFPCVYETEADGLLYKLMFVCSSSGAITDTGSAFKHPYAATENSTVLYSCDRDSPEIIAAHTVIRRVALLFTEKWLKESFPDASNIITGIFTQLGQQSMPSFIAEAMEHSYYSIINKMAMEMDQDIFPVIHIKTRSLMLLNGFLDKVVGADERSPSGQTSLYQESIIQVEQRVKEQLLSSRPCIKTLASEFNMSSSTLQRHFKMVYGKNIYQYYLEQKLLLGRELINSRKKSVSEIAYMLGYNKINSFSKVFKKYFGILPKDISALKKYST